tara:strand:+ start:1013 stop:1201 length:189 start_codon:yes stop_codon:yes gene_type:complete
LVSVKVRNDEPFERALRRFKKKWEKAGILKDVKSKAFYLKPSEQKKLAKAKVPLWKKKKNLR